MPIIRRIIVRRRVWRIMVRRRVWRVIQRIMDDSKNALITRREKHRGIRMKAMKMKREHSRDMIS
jgi:hypothetical protein